MTNDVLLEAPDPSLPLHVTLRIHGYQEERAMHLRPVLYDATGETELEDQRLAAPLLMRVMSQAGISSAARKG